MAAPTPFFFGRVPKGSATQVVTVPPPPVAILSSDKNWDVWGESTNGEGMAEQVDNNSSRL
jgi:hypothetical protein